MGASLAAILAGETQTTLAVFVAIDAATPVRRVSVGRSLSLDGNTYTPDDFAFGEIRQSVAGERPGLELSFQNVEHPSTGAALPWSTYLAADPLNGSEVTITLASTGELADTAERISERRWYVSGWTLDRSRVRFRLGSPHDALAFEVPTRTLGGRRCGWTYKHGPCTSTSNLTTCPKDIAGCVARFPAGATLPFGPAFPFLTLDARRRR